MDLDYSAINENIYVIRPIYVKLYWSSKPYKNLIIHWQIME